jgi:hypothetical protein
MGVFKMLYNLFCLRCCNKIYDNSVIVLFNDVTDPTKQDFICKRCWGEMTEKEKEFENCWIHPKEILI